MVTTREIHVKFTLFVFFFLFCYSYPSINLVSSKNIVMRVSPCHGSVISGGGGDKEKPKFSPPLCFISFLPAVTRFFLDNLPLFFFFLFHLQTSIYSVFIYTWYQPSALPFFFIFRSYRLLTLKQPPSGPLIAIRTPAVLTTLYDLPCCRSLRSSARATQPL